MSAPISDRAALAALSTVRTPEQIAAELAELGPVALWEKLSRADNTGRLRHYRPDEELAAAELTADFVIPDDDCWPSAVDALGEFRPLGLWVRGRGDLDLLTAGAIAVTGRRAASDHGIRTAQHLARGLAEQGRTVTATLAFGIDTAAHTGAHQVPAPTLAVLPCGLDLAHPYRHADLARRVLDGDGLTVSAFRPGTPASIHTLATTGRLVGALAAAVVLVEPPHDVSAPMQARSYAQRLRRPVFVVPPTEPHTPDQKMTAQMLRSGRARPASSPADILTALMRISTRLRNRFHRTARFWPARRDEPGSLPALQAAGVLVFAYIDDEPALRVSVDLDTAHRALLRPDRTVPLHITVQGTTVFRG